VNAQGTRRLHLYEHGVVRLHLADDTISANRSVGRRQGATEWHYHCSGGGGGGGGGGRYSWRKFKNTTEIGNEKYV
jgi:hypothetical protein